MDQLASRIKLSDEQAFELLFRKYYVRLCTYANKFLNDPEEAKEVVQEVFTKIWEGREDIDPEESLKSYIFKITQNLSINKLRKRKLVSKYTEIYWMIYVDKHEFSGLESLLGRELEENVAHSIGNMPAQCRKVFELSRIEGLKYKEIAEVLNISVKTVEAQMSKALRSLRTDLAEYLTS
jgi:RNA polymerase sigma-70 factor (ECF subfamily)